MSLVPIKVQYGCDPEVFLSRDGEVIGSEVVVPASGFKPGNQMLPAVVRDGVQVEFNPMASLNTVSLGRNIAVAMDILHRAADKAGATIDFRQLVDVPREYLNTLSKRSRELGCEPSENVYGVRPFKCDPDTYTIRTTGGHLHFGLIMTKLHSQRTGLITPFDIFVGNTLVMLDKDYSQVIRRENYGRAGEFRKPHYGIEYRTPSNFWLRSFPLMDLVFGLADIAMSVVSYKFVTGENIEFELAASVDIASYITAIDENDSSLARTNFEADIVPFLRKYLPQTGFVLNPKSIDKFLRFVEKPMKEYFPDPVKDWRGLCSGGKFVRFDEFLEKV